MNKVLLYIFSGILFFVLTAGIVYTSGSPGGYTGSSGDGNADCTNCHGGTASNQTGWITSNIPQTGYIAGQTYTITATGTLTGATKVGFEITCEDAQNAKTGTFAITNSTETKLVNSNKAITQKGGGTTPSSGTKSWSMNWTAPSSGSGTVTFYAAFNIKTTVRNTYTSTLAVNENTTGVETTDSDNFISVYPNPVRDILYINKNVNINNLSITDLSGKIVMQYSSNIENIDLSNLKSGIYTLVINSDNNNNFVNKIIKY